MNVEPIKVLLVENDPNDVDLIQIALAQADFGRIDWDQVDSLGEAIESLGQTPFDLLLLDLSLPDAWGLDTVKQVRQQALDIPIVVLTGNADAELALEAVRLGAQDYLVKGQVSNGMLVRTIRHAIERHHLLKDLETQITALLHSEIRFHKMIEHNADAIVIVDRAGLIRFVNPAAERLFGRRAEYLLNQLFKYPIVVDEPTEITITCPNEKDFLAFAEMRVVEMTWEEQSAYLASLRDITERKRVEKTLRDHMRELEARNEELDAFAHSTAHDLRNPLTLIVGFAKMLEEEYSRIPTVEIQSTLKTIADTGQKMSHIIDGLLVLAGLRNQEITVEPLDMDSIMRDVRQQLSNLIDTYQVEINMPAQWPTVIGYRPWVEQVWANYLTNGIKYGGLPPRLELGADIQSHNIVRFWVRDNGPGLTLEEQKRLFVPFTRLKRSEQADNGYGLGLSIVKRIVERLGGRVGVVSPGIPGQGSEFFFTLSSRS
ncbi:MAG TPA: response regulator [Anaerolineae bacterium]|nr:response regulator [Anaerolineae bacterium]MCB0179009.1 response regulator [Anaerolineae bacterium]MCB9103449.1 response regulator [Anaerolineales bacterium]HRV93357.1 response regulator [Anaerolineae bacterium]